MKITELDVCGSEEGQADKLELIMRTAFSHPSMTGIFLWGFWDGKQWRDCGLWAQDWSPKKAAQRYRSLVFDEWWTDTLVVADETGTVIVPAFYGEYTVRAGADSVTHSFTRQTENDTVAIGEPVAARPAMMRPVRPAVVAPAIRRVYTPGATQIQLDQESVADLASVTRHIPNKGEHSRKLSGLLWTLLQHYAIDTMG
jgi:hypothetical protein